MLQAISNIIGIKIGIWGVLWFVNGIVFAICVAILIANEMDIKD